MNPAEFTYLLEKLEEDELIFIEKNEVKPLIIKLLYKGYFFKGYEVALKEQSYEITRIRENDRQIRLLTLVLAIGSIGVLFIEGLKFLIDYF